MSVIYDGDLKWRPRWWTLVLFGVGAVTAGYLWGVLQEWR